MLEGISKGYNVEILKKIKTGSCGISCKNGTVLYFRTHLRF